MTITRNIKIVFCLLMFPFCCAMAQEEYTWEMGGVIGGSFYMGDANSSTPFKAAEIARGIPLIISHKKFAKVDIALPPY